MWGTVSKVLGKCIFQRGYLLGARVVLQPEYILLVQLFFYGVELLIRSSVVNGRVSLLRGRGRGWLCVEAVHRDASFTKTARTNLPILKLASEECPTFGKRVCSTRLPLGGPLYRSQGGAAVRHRPSFRAVHCGTVHSRDEKRVQHHQFAWVT